MDVGNGLGWAFLISQAAVVVCQNYPPSVSPGLLDYFSVFENVSIGSVIFTLRVIDMDPGDQVTFRAATVDVHAEPPVKISQNEWASNVTLKAELDRENGFPNKQLFFSLTDSYGLTTTVKIIMMVMDVNDNPPNFLNLPYRISIKEDVPAGSTVFKVAAKDPDNYPGNLITYNLTTTNSGYNSTFELRSNGEIIMTKPLDYEKMSFYHYNVTAKDQGYPPCPGDTCPCRGKVEICDPGPVDLFITIIDVQDTPPIFDKLPYIGTVLENETHGYSILQVIAADGDRGVSEPNIIHYSFTNGDSSSFIINKTDGIIRVKTTLDSDLDEVRNKGGLYIFTVTATEMSKDGSAVNPNPANNTSTQVSITVIDVNDNPPEFSASGYNASVQENTARGVPVTITSNIEVYDKDQGINSRFWVYLEKDGTAYDDFETLPKEGSVIQGRSTIIIRVVNSSVLDYEKTKIITFKLIAKENNSNPSIRTSSEVNVTLYIEDTNDNNPYFPNQPTTFSVSEDAPVGSEVATVTAMDVDSGDYGDIVFSLEDDGLDDTFNISEKGLIQVKRLLDRELHQTYILVVVASDSPISHEDQRRKSTLRIQINLTDVNDNYPIWTQFIQQVNVLESSPLGLKIADLKAVDNDDDLNGQIEYSISSGTNGSGLFKIIKTRDSAEISVQDSLIDHVGLLLVQVVAKDKGTPPKNASLNLLIFVIDENQNRPIFVNPDQNKYNSSTGLLPEIIIDEEQPLESKLFTLRATDKDTGQNGLVMYYLDPTTNRDYEYFIVDRINGTLKSARRLDREIKETYEVQVRAEDNGQPAPLSTTLIIRVKLNDINDNEPMYRADSMPQVLQVVEEKSNSFIGQILAAVDFDLYPHNQTCYYLYGGDRLSDLDLDKQSRNLSITKKIDRETTSALNIVIKASENCTLPSNFFILASNSSPTPSSTSITNEQPVYNSSDNSLLWVKLTVVDINDNPPQFVNHDVLTSVIYDIDIGTEILSLAESITDKDTPSNRRNRFKLVSITAHLESGQSFDISKEAFLVSSNGSVRTNVRFQSDLLGYFLLQVLAYDDDGFNDTASIKVFLISTLDRLMLVFNKLPNQVEELKDSFARQLSDILKVNILIDKIMSHANLDGKRDLTRTDAYIHGRYQHTGKVVPAIELRQLLDFNTAARSLLYSNGVIEAQTLTQEKLKDESKELKIIFAIIVSVLAVIVVALFVVLIHMVRLYRRRLRAATTMAYDAPKDKETLQHPGTNKYLAAMKKCMRYKIFKCEQDVKQERENPLFGKDIKQVDIADDTSQNSLDVNAVGEPTTAPTSQNVGSDDEQEMFMNITEYSEVFSSHDDHHNYKLDHQLQDYNNIAFTRENNDTFTPVLNGRKRPSLFLTEYGPHNPNTGHSTQGGESEIYDEIYNSALPEFLTSQTNLNYTEI